MNHHVQEYFRSVSEQLSTILDIVGYSWEDRDRTVNIATEIEVLGNITAAMVGKPRLYVFGSRGEGSTGPELKSDVDILFQINEVAVITDLSQYQPEMYNVLMVKDNHTHPGYVKLEHTIPIIHAFLSRGTPLSKYLDLQFDDVVAIDCFNRFVLPNTVLVRFGTLTGPALHASSVFKEFSIDKVYALRCKQWPKDEYEWYQRRRIYGWLSRIQIENAMECGCFVTPVGHVFSSERPLEWRLSFSIAERFLTRSFEDTTMKVYIVLKMIKKTYIKPVVADAFSSYHCKVCLLWVRERTPRELWNNGNLLYCLILCIRQLYEWVTTGFCPDYFIVTNNIYDRKIVGAVRFNLEQIFGYLLSSDCTFLLGIQCCNLGQYITNGISRWDDLLLSIAFEDHVHYIFSIKASCDCRYYIFQSMPQRYSTLVDYLDRIMHASKDLPFIMQYPLKQARMILWSQLGFHIAALCREKAHNLSQEEINVLAALASGCLSFGINSDATSVRLKLCGLGMEFGNHDLIESLLQNISNYRMRYIGSVGLKLPRTVLKGVDFLNRGIYRKKIFGTEELLQTQTTASVVYLPCEIAITPKSLRIEMFRSIAAPPQFRDKDDHIWFDWGVVDSHICLYFFQYLILNRQGNERHKQVAIDNMVHVIRSADIFHGDTALNLLGYVFMQENQLTNAFRCFKQSLKVRPYHNAAKFHLGILFKRVRGTDIGHTHYGS